MSDSDNTIFIFTKSGLAFELIYMRLFMSVFSTGFSNYRYVCVCVCCVLCACVFRYIFSPSALLSLNLFNQLYLGDVHVTVWFSQFLFIFIFRMYNDNIIGKCAYHCGARNEIVCSLCSFFAHVYFISSSIL